MRKHYRLYLAVCLTLLSFARTINSAILPSWNNKIAYHPDPLVFVHGMNSSPEAWGFVIDPRTEDVIGYIPITAYNLFQYFDNYLERNPDTKELLRYIEPFNYEFNTFDSISWNAWEGYDNNGLLQYPDKRIPDVSKRLVLKEFIGEPFISPSSPGSGILSKYQRDKVQLVAHSLGGVVSRYYLHNTKSGGANVTQLTTLGSPHSGTLMAKIARDIFGRPVTDIQNMGSGRRFFVIMFTKIFGQLQIPVDRYPAMVDEVQRDSDFLLWLNKPADMPRSVRHYCIADALSPCGWISWLPLSLTDGFIELDSALGVSPTEQLPCPDLEEYKPKGYLPKYKGRLLTGKENWHINLTNRADEILKAIDDTKPVIELTDVKDTQNRVLWRVGQWPEYFEVPQDGRLKIQGLCRKEYLPADTSINIGFRKAGQTGVNWITESGGLTPDQAQARQWLLQPSDLWGASDPNSPVAEFEVEIDFPLQEVTHSIVVQAANPAGIKSDPAEVSEKTHYIYAVGKDEDGGAKFLCLDGPSSFADGVEAVVSEFDLVDEEGNKMFARPLDIATDSRTIGTTIWASNIWVSFDDKKIYCYDIASMKPKPLLPNQYYYTTTATPDGLYYDGNLQYCSSSNNKIYRINITDGTETDLEEVKRRLSIDGVVTDSPSVNYTTQEYVGYNPVGITTNYLCSLGKISKRDTSIGQKFVQTLPTDTPIWINEHDTPAPCLGIVETTDPSVPSSRAIYLSCTDGNVYKMRFVDKTVGSSVSTMWGAAKNEWNPSPYYNPDQRRYYYSPSYAAWTGFASVSGRSQFTFSSYLFTTTGRTYARAPVLPSFIEAFVVHKPSYWIFQHRWDGIKWVSELPNVPIASTIWSICSYDETWTPEQQFNALLISTLWTTYYDDTSSGSGRYPGESSLAVSVTNVSNLTFPFYYTGRYGNESQTFPVGPVPQPSPPPTGYIGRVDIMNTAGNILRDTWVALTNNGLLETLAKFRISIPIAEGIATGPRVKIRIEPEFLLLNIGQSGQLKVNGRGPYLWESSDETVALVKGTIPMIGGSGEAVSVKPVGVGESTLSVRDALGNIAYASVKVE